MKLAQKQHNRIEMEKSRIAFYQRFADNGPYSKIVVEPTSVITCQNYRQSRRNIRISCIACRDNKICAGPS